MRRTIKTGGLSLHHDHRVCVFLSLLPFAPIATAAVAACMCMWSLSCPVRWRKSLHFAYSTCCIIIDQVHGSECVLRLVTVVIQGSKGIPKKVDSA